MSDADTILDDLFHGCAFQAFVEELARTNCLPDSDRTKWRAYAFYEASLAEANASRQKSEAVPCFGGRDHVI
jgi:hypothetical protein